MKLRAQWILISFVVKVSREEYTNFSAFRRLGLLPQVFRQVKEHLILQLHEMIRVLHEVACPIVFFFFFMIDIGREECSNLLNIIIFLVFLAVLVFFPKCFDRLVCSIY